MRPPAAVDCYNKMRNVPFSPLTFEPTAEAIEELSDAWAWLLKYPFRPVLFSILGDMFFTRDNGSVWWLNTGAGEVTRVAESVDDFQQKLGTELADEWFLPHLVEQLHAAGKIPEPGECYTYVTLPIFQEGKYVVDNLNPVPADEHFALTGEVHHQIAALPEGARVKVTVTH
jgi:type VI secretion system (T6SS) immunity protein Tdi1